MDFCPINKLDEEFFTDFLLHLLLQGTVFKKNCFWMVFMIVVDLHSDTNVESLNGLEIFLVKM